MGEITLNEIRDFMLWLIAFFTATYTIINAIKKAITKGFEPVNKKIEEVDINATKNYLVARISDIKSGNDLDDISRERFFEEYEHYLKLKGNSYIKNEVEKLIKANKL